MITLIENARIRGISYRTACLRFREGRLSTAVKIGGTLFMNEHEDFEVRGERIPEDEELLKYKYLVPLRTYLEINQKTNPYAIVQATNLVHNGRLPSVKVGGTIMVDKRIPYPADLRKREYKEAYLKSLEPKKRGRKKK